MAEYRVTLISLALSIAASLGVLLVWWWDMRR